MLTRQRWVGGNRSNHQSEEEILRQSATTSSGKYYVIIGRRKNWRRGIVKLFETTDNVNRWRDDQKIQSRSCSIMRQNTFPVPSTHSLHETKCYQSLIIDFVAIASSRFLKGEVSGKVIKPKIHFIIFVRSWEWRLDERNLLIYLSLPSFVGDKYVMQISTCRLDC